MLGEQFTPQVRVSLSGSSQDPFALKARFADITYVDQGPRPVHIRHVSLQSSQKDVAATHMDLWSVEFNGTLPFH